MASGLVGARAAHVAAAGPVAIATSATLDASADGAELSFDLTAPVQPTAYVLADPDRVIVDLPEVDFRAAPATPRHAGRHRRRTQAGGLVASYRFGLVAPGRSRIVVDLAGPARIVSAKIVQIAGRPRLVVGLARTDAASFATAARAHVLTAAVPAPAAPAQLAPDPRPPSSSTPATAAPTPARSSTASSRRT